MLLSAEGEEDTLTARVRNHGTVIPEDSLEVIFAPLTQLAKEVQGDARPRTSLGLGLFVAREIASAHGGTITVKSNEAEGTEFTLRLPRTQPGTPEPRSPLLRWLRGHASSPPGNEKAGLATGFPLGEATTDQKR